MNRLRVIDRNRSMNNLVSFHDVPMPRMVAFVIRDIERHGSKVRIYSADRTVAAIAEHNQKYHTNLHAQQYLYDHQGEQGFNPANPPSQTSHCYYADVTIGALLNVPVGGRIPRYAVGLDLADGDVLGFIHTGAELGYHVSQPYHTGSEFHHVVITKSPITTLERRHQISRLRVN